MGKVGASLRWGGIIMHGIKKEDISGSAPSIFTLFLKLSTESSAMCKKKSVVC